MILKKYCAGKWRISVGSLTSFIASLILLSPLAAESNSLDYAFSGYGTLGYAFLNDENAEYRTGEGDDGATDDGSFKVDSRFAVQFDAAFNSRVSTSVQLIARQDGEGNTAAEVEWGFLRLLPADTVEMRLGRMSLPIFSLSDSREVGYANVMLRPPEDVYVQIPLKRLNGADVTVESLVLDSLVTVQLYTGFTREEIFDDLEPDAQQILGLSTWIERGPIKARFNFTQAQLDLSTGNAEFLALRQGIDATLAQFPELGSRLNPVREDVSEKRRRLTFASLGLIADFSRFFIDVEFAQRLSEKSVLADVHSWSVAGGGKFGKFTPYLFISEYKPIDGDRRVDLSDVPVLASLEAGINSLYEPSGQSSVGAGLRFDFSENIALKSQVELISRDERGVSFVRSDDDGSDKGDDVVLASFVLDFVF